MSKVIKSNNVLTSWKLFSGLLVTLFLLACSAQAFAAQQKMTDQNITDAIEDEMLFESYLPTSRISVSTVGGIVTLRGVVSNLLAKERAVKVAETVKGVRSVVDRILVEPVWDRSNREIENDVKQALLWDPATDSYEVKAKARKGSVTLTGNVDSWQEKYLAETVAKGVRGVKQLNNKLTVSYKMRRPDTEIEPEVAQQLYWNRLVDDGLINVKVQDGTVYLSGIVGSAAERSQAISTAWVGGVKAVDASTLQVEKWARDKALRKQKYVKKTDGQIRSAVEAAMLYDPRIASFNVNVSVNDATVTLRGVVDNLKAKRSAAQDARNTVGVLRVEDRLKVKPSKDIKDGILTKKASQAIDRNPFIERFNIDVNVTNGIAYLSGTVDSFFDKAELEEVVSRQNGVVDVKNNVAVVNSAFIYPNPYVYDTVWHQYDWYTYTPTYSLKTDGEIKHDIERQLFWSPFVDLDEVNVSVDKGVVTLRGNVDSWMEMEAATENAFEGGAVQVYNKLDLS